MAAIAIVSGALEGLQLIEQASATITAVTQAVQAAQASGQPVDWSGILGAESTAEANLLAAIAAAKAAGK
jgi:hypothetical protein